MECCVTSIYIAIMQIQGVYGAGMAETAITENSPMFPLRLYLFCWVHIIFCFNFVRNLIITKAFSSVKLY